MKLTRVVSRLTSVPWAAQLIPWALATSKHPLILRIADRLIRGSHADLFAPGDGRVYKLFRVSRSDIRTREARTAFDSEARAFEIASEAADLRDHVATFFGRIRVESVIDRRSRRLDRRYLLDCCYVLEQMEGQELSPFGVREAREGEILELLRRFETAGINYPEDGSVFGWEPGRTIKFVDIATRDVRAAFA